MGIIKSLRLVLQRWAHRTCWCVQYPVLCHPTQSIMSIKFPPIIFVCWNAAQMIATPKSHFNRACYYRGLQRHSAFVWPQHWTFLVHMSFLCLLSLSCFCFLYGVLFVTRHLALVLVLDLLWMICNIANPIVIRCREQRVPPGDSRQLQIPLNDDISFLGWTLPSIAPCLRVVCYHSYSQKWQGYLTMVYKFYHAVFADDVDSRKSSYP